MVAQECSPSLRWRPSAPDHVLGDRRLGDLEPELDGGQSWTSSHRHHEETGEFRSIQVFDFVKHAPDHVLKRYETSLNV